jgi:hypothetical protein
MRKARRSEQDTLRQRLQIELGFNWDKDQPGESDDPGRDIATVNLEFKVRGHDLIGRQSQTWALPRPGCWKVISAHVSTMNDRPQW